MQKAFSTFNLVCQKETNVYILIWTLLLKQKTKFDKSYKDEARKVAEPLKECKDENIYQYFPCINDRMVEMVE